MSTNSSPEGPKVSIRGWNALKLAGWEYKNTQLGQYMRYNPKMKKNFKHNIVFLAFGDPSNDQIDLWLDMVKKCTNTWPNVEIVSVVNNISNKRQRLAVDVVCVRCMERITSLFEIRGMEDI